MQREDIMKINKDIHFEINDDKNYYIDDNEDEIINNFIDDDKEIEDFHDSDKAKIYVNCKLNVDFDTKNKAIYLCPGKFQYFTVNVSKSCGDVIVRYNGCYSSEGICGNLGIYKLVESGIVVETYYKLNPKKKDFLNFTAVDKCTKECYDFVVVFSYNPCEDCY